MSFLSVKWVVPYDGQIIKTNEEFRVMYREGPEGTPIHTLLVEGYVDGPLDLCESSYNEPKFLASSFYLV